MKRFMMMAVCACALAACTEHKDYSASAKCQADGYQPGTAEYEKCLTDERAAKLMEQQRYDYEQMKRQQDDFRLRGY